MPLWRVTALRWFPQILGHTALRRLTRRVGETIVIAGHIEVTVVSVQGERVRLGVSAPVHVLVDRKEIHERRFHAGAPLQRSEALWSAAQNSVLATS